MKNMEQSVSAIMQSSSKNSTAFPVLASSEKRLFSSEGATLLHSTYSSPLPKDANRFSMLLSEIVKYVEIEFIFPLSLRIRLKVFVAS